MATRIPKELIKDLPNLENSGNSSSGNSGSGNSNVNFDLDKVIVREGILETGVYSFTTDKVANASDSYTELYLDGVKVPTGSYTLTTRDDDTLVTLKYAVSKDTWFNITIFQGLNIEATRNTRVDIWETGPGIPFDYGIDPSEDDGTDGIKFRVCADATNANYFSVVNGTLPVDNYDVYINGELTEQKCNALTFAANDTIEIKAHDGVTYYPYFKPNNNSVIQKILKPLPLMCNTWNSPTVVTDYSTEFYYCSSLTDICEGLFKNFKEHIKNASRMFANCGTLRYLPSDLFSNCTNLTTVNYLIQSCNNIKHVGSNLFYNCKNLLISDNSTSPFNGCNSIEIIGSNTFANCTKITVTSPGSLFSLMTNLREVGSGTFANCESITSLQGIFSSRNLLEKIGSNTFANCINCKNFNNAFSNTSITNIDSSTFVGCTAATSFNSSFSNCTKLKSINSNLFASSTEVTTFENTFYNCSSLTNIPQDLFINNSKVTTFNGCFSGCTSIISDVPELWNRTNVTSYSKCFYNCTNAANYSDIPTSWR